ncbi:MAG: cell division protein FtsQ/DivIB, partial [Nitriliruptoraceae bacterium]
AISPGDSLVRISTSAAAERVEALPRVSSAVVYRTWRRDVVIEVVERVPVLQAAAGGLQPRWVLIDREGVVIEAGGDDALPEIVLRGAPPGLGAHVDDNAALANAFLVWRGLSGPLRTDVHRYIANTRDELRLELRRGVIVNFGRAERIEEKIRAIGAVLADIGQREIVEIDVRAPSRPVVVLPSDQTENDDNSDPVDPS